MEPNISEVCSIEDLTNQELQKLIFWLKNRIALSSELTVIQEQVLKKYEEVYQNRLNKKKI